MKNLNNLNNLMLGVLCVGFAGCATSGSTLRVDSEEPVLLTSSGALELHVRQGRIVEVVPAVETSEKRRERTILTLDELRASWQQAAGVPLPEEGPGVIEVNGWSGLECVRKGQACGRQPDDAPRALVVIRLR
jgi:hypothetical protein